MTEDPRNVSSPCVGICALDARAERCCGCGRTLGEITAWSTMTAAEKRAVVARLRAEARGRA